MARQTLRHHRKFRDLARRVGDVPRAWGMLELVWHVAYEAGDDLIGTAQDVEEACCWRGRKGQGCEALFQAGFLDQSPEGYRVHDLWDHAPEYVKKRRQREDQRRELGDKLSKQTADKRRTNGGQAAADTSTVDDAASLSRGASPSPSPSPKDQDHRPAVAVRPRPPVEKSDNPKLLVRLAHDVLAQEPETGADAADLLKTAASRAHLPYTARAIGAALEQAHVQRHRAARDIA